MLNTRILEHVYSVPEFWAQATKVRYSIDEGTHARIRHQGREYYVVPSAFADRCRVKQIYDLSGRRQGKVRAGRSPQTTVSLNTFEREMEGLKPHEVFGLSFDGVDPIVFIRGEDYDQLSFSHARRKEREKNKSTGYLNGHSVVDEALAKPEVPVVEPESEPRGESSAFPETLEVLSPRDHLGSETASAPQVLSLDDMPRRSFWDMVAKDHKNQPVESALVLHRDKLVGVLLTVEDLSRLGFDQSEIPILDQSEVRFQRTFAQRFSKTRSLSNKSGLASVYGHTVFYATSGHILAQPEVFSKILSSQDMLDIRKAYEENLVLLLQDYWGQKNSITQPDCWDALKKGRSIFDTHPVVALRHQSTLKAFAFDTAPPKDGRLEVSEYESRTDFSGAWAKIKGDFPADKVIGWDIGRNRVVYFASPYPSNSLLETLCRLSPSCEDMLAFLDGGAEDLITKMDVDPSVGVKSIEPSSVNSEVFSPAATVVLEIASVSISSPPVVSEVEVASLIPAAVEERVAPLLIKAEVAGIETFKASSIKSVVLEPVEPVAPVAAVPLPQQVPSGVDILKQIALVAGLVKTIKAASEQIIERQSGFNFITVFNESVSREHLTESAVESYVEIYEGLKGDDDPDLNFDIVDYAGDLVRKSTILRNAFRVAESGGKLVLLKSEGAMVMIGKNKTFVDMIRALSMS